MKTELTSEQVTERTRALTEAAARQRENEDYPGLIRPVEHWLRRPDGPVASRYSEPRDPFEDPDKNKKFERLWDVFLKRFGLTHEQWVRMGK